MSLIRGESRREVSGNRPSDFGFPIDVHAHEPQTIQVVPITSDGEHFPPEGKLRVYSSRTGGSEWEPLTAGLPQANCYANVLRDAMAVDRLDPCGVYFGTTGGQVYVSPDAGDHWPYRPGSAARAQCRGADAAMIRVALPAHLRTLAGVSGEVVVAVAGPVTMRAVLEALERQYPVRRGTIREHGTLARRPFIRYFAYEEDVSQDSPDDLLPAAVSDGQEPLLIVGAMSGG